MYRKEVNERSPLRILEASIHGGLGKGHLGLVMARAGVGKTACLTQIALDDLMRERRVLHIALGGGSVERVRAWYDAVFDDLANVTALEGRRAVRAEIARNRLITAQPGDVVSPDGLRQTVDMFRKQLDFRPDAIIVDDFDWEAEELDASWVAGLKDVARHADAELWLSAQAHREDIPAQVVDVPPPCGRFADDIDVILLLEPAGEQVTIRLLKDHDHSAPPSLTRLELQCDTMRLVVAGERELQASRLPGAACTLLSGGARGAEAFFGECAEKSGVHEEHFTFEGREVSRRRGLRILTGEQLAQGAVSTRYIEAHMHRSYPHTPFFAKVLQSIWHQVNTSRAVYVIGVVKDDGTVKGGTGWAAELARRTHKPLHVFDQERAAWLSWNGTAWITCEPPVIRTRRFTGAGTRKLNDAGRAAIQSLFERSFG